MASGNHNKAIPTSVDGKMAKLMALVVTHGQMEINMKENGKTA